MPTSVCGPPSSDSRVRTPGSRRPTSHTRVLRVSTPDTRAPTPEFGLQVPTPEIGAGLRPPSPDSRVRTPGFTTPDFPHPDSSGSRHPTPELRHSGSNSRCRRPRSELGSDPRVPTPESALRVHDARLPTPGFSGSRHPTPELRHSGSNSRCRRPRSELGSNPESRPRVATLSPDPEFRPLVATLSPDPEFRPQVLTLTGGSSAAPAGAHPFVVPETGHAVVRCRATGTCTSPAPAPHVRSTPLTSRRCRAAPG